MNNQSAFRARNIGEGISDFFVRHRDAVNIAAPILPAAGGLVAAAGGLVASDFSSVAGSLLGGAMGVCVYGLGRLVGWNDKTLSSNTRIAISTAIGLATSVGVGALASSAHTQRATYSKLEPIVKSETLAKAKTAEGLKPGESFVECTGDLCVRSFITKAPTAGECGQGAIEQGGTELRTIGAIRDQNGTRFDICVPR